MVPSRYSKHLTVEMSVLLAGYKREPGQVSGAWYVHWYKVVLPLGSLFFHCTYF